MLGDTTPPDDHASEEGPPPIVTCRYCGETDCDVCATPKPKQVTRATLPWEGEEDSAILRLWRTARDSSCEPQRIFGELPDGSLASALTFAIISESSAIGSLLTVILGVAFAVAPTFTAQVTRDSTILTMVVVGSTILVGGMVAMHGLWGVALELGAMKDGRKPAWRLGLRFGFYACGWDLVTSPIGLVGSVLQGGPSHRLVLLFQAVQAPRRAMRAYLELRRGWSNAEVRRALLVSYWTLGTLMILLAVGLFFGLLWLWVGNAEV